MMRSQRLNRCLNSTSTLKTCREYERFGLRSESPSSSSKLRRSLRSRICFRFFPSSIAVFMFVCLLWEVSLCSTLTSTGISVASETTPIRLDKQSEAVFPYMEADSLYANRNPVAAVIDNITSPASEYGNMKTTHREPAGDEDSKSDKYKSQFLLALQSRKPLQTVNIETTVNSSNVTTSKGLYTEMRARRLSSDIDDGIMLWAFAAYGSLGECQCEMTSWGQYATENACLDAYVDSRFEHCIYGVSESNLELSTGEDQSPSNSSTRPTTTTTQLPVYTFVSGSTLKTCDTICFELKKVTCRESITQAINMDSSRCRNAVATVMLIKPISLYPAYLGDWFPTGCYSLLAGFFSGLNLSGNTTNCSAAPSSYPLTPLVARLCACNGVWSSSTTE